MTSTITKTGSSQREAEPAPQLLTIGLIRSRRKCAIGHAGSSKN